MKSYIQSNRQDRRGIADYTSIIEEATSRGQFPLARSGVRYFRQAAKGPIVGGGGGGNHWALGSSYSISSSSSSSSYSSSSMTDRRASLGAMLALGAAAQKAILESRFIAPVERVRWLERVAEQLELAEQLTETYHDATMASQTSTSISNSFSSFSPSSNSLPSSFSTGGLPPASFAVDAYAADRSSAIVAVQGEALTEAYLAETYLVLYRATRQPRYREYAWDLVKAVAVNGTADRDYRLPNSLYASATLKYLWLIFAEEEGTGEGGEGVEKEAPVGSSSSSTGGDNLYLPLNKWVFNEAGQPLPICGANEKVWPAERCSYRLMSYQELLVAQFDL